MDETIPPCAASGVSESERMCGRKIVQQGMFAQMMTTCILWIVPLLIVAKPVHRLRALAGDSCAGGALHGHDPGRCAGAAVLESDERLADVRPAA